jgi:hypothetical protein
MGASRVTHAEPLHPRACERWEFRPDTAAKHGRNRSTSASGGAVRHAPIPLAPAGRGARRASYPCSFPSTISRQAARCFPHRVFLGELSPRPCLFCALVSDAAALRARGRVCSSSKGLSVAPMAPVTVLRVSSGCHPHADLQGFCARERLSTPRIAAERRADRGVSGPPRYRDHLTGP